MKETNHIYGPVPSRRLGFSLGVDLVPFKTCPLDCIYCQLGRTTHQTVRRASYVPAGKVLEELEGTLKKIPAPNFIALSGSGEPTLHSGIGEVIAGIRKATRVPIAILTNGVLLGEKDVRSACLGADVVIPSLDAGDEKTYLRVNRPFPGLSCQSLVDGITGFRELFPGEVWLEVMILGGITDGEKEVRKIARQVRVIRPRRIHLNTAVRPPAQVLARAVPDLELNRIAGLFQPRAEVILHQVPEKGSPGLTVEKIIQALERRPCTVQDIAAISGISPVNVLKTIEEMTRETKIRRIRKSGRLYYSAFPEDP